MMLGKKCRGPKHDWFAEKMLLHSINECIGRYFGSGNEVTREAFTVTIVFQERMLLQ